MRPLRLLASFVGWAIAGLALSLLLGVTGRGAAAGDPSPRRRRPAPDAGGPPAPELAPELALTSIAPPIAPEPAVVPPAPVPGRAVRPRHRAVRPRRRAVGAHAHPAAAAGKAARLLGTFALHTILGLALGVLLSLTVPLAVGMRPLVVLTGSMEPVLHVGDVTVVQAIAPRDARVGDVVTFKAPGTGRVTTHRVRAVRVAEQGRFVFTTKGDANNALERWTLPADGQLSRATYTVPLVGRALLAIHKPLGWALLVGLPLLALGAQEIRRIWRTAPAASSEGTDAPLVA